MELRTSLSQTKRGHVSLNVALMQAFSRGQSLSPVSPAGQCGVRSDSTSIYNNMLSGVVKPCRVGAVVLRGRTPWSSATLFVGRTGDAAPVLARTRRFADSRAVAQVR